MQSFNILKKNSIEKTYRVSKIMADYDINLDQTNENFIGEFNINDDWNIGLIYGSSGTGKTTIANEIFKKNIVKKYQYNNNSVLDNMPKDLTVDEITKLFYAVGFSSVPCWLKPYHVLSNGEKMRVDLARAILENDIIAFDEFTSVVDREVAKTISISLHKTIKRLNKKFIAISCHNDIIEYLQPDWTFNTNNMKFENDKKKDQKWNSKYTNVTDQNGKFLSVIII